MASLASRVPEIAATDARRRWADVQAGAVTAAVLIPQAMAYAQLAGLPAQAGLYAAMIAPFAYVLLGTSPVLIVAPAALDSLLIASAVAPVVALTGGDYLALALTLGLLIGLVQIALGLFGGGFLVNFLSRPVLSGFTSAAAVVIAAQQLPALLGVHPAEGETFWTYLMLPLQPDRWHGPTAAIGVVATITLLAGRRLAPRVPWVILVLAVAAGGVAALGLADTSLKLVGEVPAGLPSFALPSLNPDWIRALAPSAAMMAFLSLTEGISAASACRIDRTPLRPGREFVGVGLANAAVAGFGGMVVAGGLSRTAVNWRAGARSKLASLVAAGIVGATLLWFSGALALVPRAALAAVIVISVGSLIDLAEIRRLFRVKRADMWLALLTAAVTLFVGIVAGIAAGIGASLLWLVIRTTQPHTAVLGRLPGSREFRNVRNYPEAVTFPGVLILRMDAQFYFGNVAFLRDTLRKLEHEQATPLRAVVLDASGMNQLDSSAVGALEEMIADYRGRGIELLLANVKIPVRNVLEASGVLASLGEEKLFLCVNDAVEAALAES